MVLQVDDDKKEGKAHKRVWLSLRLSRMYKGLSLDAIQDGMVFIFALALVFSRVHFGSRYA